jgi:hypothetical protein
MTDAIVLEHLRCAQVHLESLELAYAHLARFALVRDAFKAVNAFALVVIGGDPQSLWPDTTDAAAELFRARQSLYEAENALRSLADSRLAQQGECIRRARTALDDFPDGSHVTHLRAAHLCRVVRSVRRELASSVDRGPERVG